MANFINLSYNSDTKIRRIYMSDDKVVSLGAKKKANSEHSEEKSEKFEPVYCSFCGRPNTQVIKMVQGPGVNICSECAMIAVQYLILQDRMPSAEAQHILDAFWGKAR
jgi:hypothetical protein